MTHQSFGGPFPWPYTDGQADEIAEHLGRVGRTHRMVREVAGRARVLWMELDTTKIEHDDAAFRAVAAAVASLKGTAATGWGHLDRQIREWAEQGAAIIAEHKRLQASGAAEPVRRGRPAKNPPLFGFAQEVDEIWRLAGQWRHRQDYRRVCLRPFRHHGGGIPHSDEAIKKMFREAGRIGEGRGFSMVEGQYLILAADDPRRLDMKGMYPGLAKLDMPEDKSGLNSPIAA